MNRSSVAQSVLEEVVRVATRRRVSLDVVWRAFYNVTPALAGAPDSRPTLAGILTELANKEELTLPKNKALWEASPSPPLPQWIELPAVYGPVQRAPDHRMMSWPPQLAFVTSLGRVKNLEELVAIRDFLATRGDQAQLVPLRERSLELFGDEKRLDTLRRSSLFGPGRLSLSALRCTEVQLPITWEIGPKEATRGLLVIENLHTYDSFRRYNAKAALYKGVAYGAGNSFRNTVRDLPRVLRRLECNEALYFGDLDAKGIEIPIGAAALLTSLNGTLSLRPELCWYEALLQRALERRLPGPKQEVSRELLSQWLGPTLGQQAYELCQSGLRAPQEFIGWDALSMLLDKRKE